MTVRLALLLVLLLPVAASAQGGDTLRGQTPEHRCTSCAEWNRPHRPFRLYGNSWYVGTEGLSAVLLTSPRGHVLLDAALPESAELIMANIRALGFRVEDVKLIVNSHAHFDHAGGIAAIERVSGARVAASPRSAPVLLSGVLGADDPQFGIAFDYPAVRAVTQIRDGQTLRVGPIAVTAHFTPGHTAGGTSWSWRSCEGGRCLSFVYADSQTPVSADGFLFTRNTTYPTVLADFARGHARLESLPCDVLLTPHPSASRLWERMGTRARGSAAALVERGACRRYAENARRQLARRVESERAK